jgi:uncharacterized coiled-coil protein SlyX
MPPKQQKLFFADDSSSSGKRPRENSPFHSQSGGSSSTISAQNIFETLNIHANNLEMQIHTFSQDATKKFDLLLDTIVQQNTTITKLQEQVNELVSRPSPSVTPIFEVGKQLVQPHPQQNTPPPHAKAQQKRAGTATSAPTPAPKKPPPATSAKVDAEAGFTTVSHKKRKTKKPTTLLPTPLPTADRKIVFKLSARATDSPHTVATRALQVVNKAIDAHPDISHPPCVSAHLTQSNAVVIVVAESYLATDYEPYLGILQETLKADGFPLAGSFVSERWTRFVLNGVPTKATPEEVQREMGSLYPSIRLGLPPRWLTTPDKREGKEASSMVITLTGTHTIKSIGRSRLYLFNNRCNLEEYITFGPRTRCGRCQLYGHPTSMCSAPFPACGVCAQPHLTKHHPCAIPSCKKGAHCSHPPVMCVSCRQPHKASDPTCATFLKLLTQGSSKEKEAVASAEVEVSMAES